MNFAYPFLFRSTSDNSVIQIVGPPWSSGSVLDYRSLPPVFKSQRGHILRLFCLSLRLITFGGRSPHLAYLVHKSGRKTSIIIIVSNTNINFICIIIIILITVKVVLAPIVVVFVINKSETDQTTI